MKRLNRCTVAVIAFMVFLMLVPNVEAKRSNYYFNENGSYLKGSIKYTLIGSYKASFEEFEGVLKFDDRDMTKSSVNLKVKTASISSKYPTLDRIVRSSQLLDAGRYPYINFESHSIRRVREGYMVNGTVNLNDIDKDLSFVFDFEGPFIENGEEFVLAKGRWILNRKDFEIIWSRWLDHGGIIVGDEIIVDWEIQAFR